MFKKSLIIFGLGLVVVLGWLVLLVGSRGVVIIEVVEARSGCCSGHGGVCAVPAGVGGSGDCGYECCDGKRLSTTCQKYYPTQECEKNTLALAKFINTPIDINNETGKSSEDDGLMVLLLVLIPVILVWILGKRGGIY